jgi:hypothetical protein
MPGKKFLTLMIHKSMVRIPNSRFVILMVSILLISGCSNSVNPIIGDTPAVTASTTPKPLPLTQTPAEITNVADSRGYLTTPQELKVIAGKANEGIEPYHSAVIDVLKWADREWNYELNAQETCANSNEPVWNDNGGGTPILYAKAMAYHLTGDVHYAEEVKNILERIMTEVVSISDDTNRCQLNFAWGTPELVASADLIEAYWKDQTCTGPTSTSYFESEIGSGPCKSLFQNWLVKNPYYIISLSAETGMSNWGAAATNALAYIADYLWDRPEVLLIHRLPLVINRHGIVTYSPSEAYFHANQLALDRMNGYRVEYRSNSSCDVLEGEQQRRDLEPVKSQITEHGIIPEEARREEYCNITQYNGIYQNYPQLYLGHNIQQCELMLRRGDTSCFDNVEMTDIPEYSFVGPDGNPKTTHLYPGRGSIERAIKAIIADSKTEWRHESALDVAFRYYYIHHTLPGFELWAANLSGRRVSCDQDICFGGLTHGFSIQEGIPSAVPTVLPP